MRRRSAEGLVVIAASAGGLQALEVLLAALPADLPAAVAIVLHRTTQRPNLAAQVLGRHTKAKVKIAEEGEHPVAGTIYVAPPDRHLTLRADRHFHLIDGHRIRHLLSSANPLFDTAAQAFGPNVVAIVLTGGNSDGTDGVQSVAGAGGVVIAQDPATADVPSMPQSAIATGVVGHILPLGSIAARVVTETQRWRPSALEAKAPS